MRSLLFALIAGLCASSAFAQWLPGHDYVLDRAGNVIHVRGPTITTPDFLPKAGTGAVVPYKVTGTPTGAVITSQKAINVANQRAIIEAAKTIPWKNVAIGVARTARISPYSIAAGFAVEWLVDNGWRYQQCLNDASTCDGEIQWQKRVSDSEVAVMPGSGTWIEQSKGGPGVAGYSTAEAACRAVAATYGGTYTNMTYLSPTQYSCRTAQHGSLAVVSKQAYCQDGSSPDSSGKCSIPGFDPWVNSPPPNFDTDPPNPPDPGKAPDIWGDALPGGIPDSDGGPSVSGPASVPGPSSTTTRSDGSTSTTNTVNNFTYNNNNSTVTVTTTTTTTTTAPNGSTSSEQTTEEGKPEPEESVPPPRDPDMPEVPTLYEKKYPDGPSGVPD